MTATRRSAFVDPYYLLAAIAAIPALIILAAVTPVALSLSWPPESLLLTMVVVSPVLEEIVFRAGVQDSLARRTSSRVGRLTIANIATALLFCGMHLWRHPPAWALATAVPALVFGLVYERHGTLLAPIGLHAFYNLAYLTLLSHA